MWVTGCTYRLRSIEECKPNTPKNVKGKKKISIMKYLVCISKTPDTTSKIAFTADQKEYDGNGVQFIMNPYDEWYALVRAVELKEKDNGELVLINVGGPENETIIRKGLAIGGDKAVRVNTKTVDSFQVASQIAAYAKEQSFDIIFTGKETIDYNGSEVPAMVAELLGVPFVSYASKLELSGNTATVTREIEGGSEEVEVSTPFVLSAAKGLAEQRIPNMRGIMMAKTKPIETREPVAAENMVFVERFDTPAPKSSVTLVDPDNMDELVRLLHEEAKII
jgi:electron transfer flavoprotein beta subunit